MATIQELAQKAETKRTDVDSLFAAMEVAREAYDSAVQAWILAKTDLEGLDAAVTTEALRPGSVLR